jgi:hypothetical protein
MRVSEARWGWWWAAYTWPGWGVEVASLMVLAQVVIRLSVSFPCYALLSALLRGLQKVWLVRGKVESW